jgi:rod shape-determining protein MreD
MFASLVQGSILRLVLVGLVLLPLQRTIFTEMRPFGVAIQVVLAMAAACGAGGGGPQKGALAGFVLGLMYDLGVGTPLGSSSISMGLGGFTAGYVTSITTDPQWWLAALFTGLGAAVGETAVPVVRAFIGEEHVFTPRLYTIVPVVAVSAMVMSPVLVPLGRWCMKVKRPEWKAIPEREATAE